MSDARASRLPRPIDWEYTAAKGWIFERHRRQDSSQPPKNPAPTLPLYLRSDGCVPVELEATYNDASYRLLLT